MVYAQAADGDAQRIAADLNRIDLPNTKQLVTLICGGLFSLTQIATGRSRDTEPVQSTIGEKNSLT